MTTRRAIMSGSAFEEHIGYARAAVDGDWVHVSGTTGFDYAATTISDDVVEQAEQCLRNIGAALAEAECSFADAVRPDATMLVCGLADPRMEIEIEVYARRGSGDRD
ncbi:Rid family hydrolase [Streptomyces canus]|uniref:Rid family hydrolase n=1 Tax=Streptomyces canus TaxID=58343 RepID=UPI00225995F5|nr:Rid family hydrolase [Streptomyces canus]MCX5256363.1 Rid family hydrolase [Streptomyces canus]